MIAVIIVAVGLIILGLIIFVIYLKVKGGVTNFLTNGLNPHDEFSTLILSMADYIQQKRAAMDLYLPRYFVDDERWLLDSQVPKTFYYIDESQINDMYSQLNSSHKLEEFTEKEKQAKGFDGGISGSALSIKGNKATESERTKKFTLDISTPSKYNFIETYLKDNILINYGIAKFYTDDTQKIKFYESCEKLEEDFKFKISETERDKHWINLNKELSYPTLEGIKNSSGNIAFQEDFSIEHIDEHVKLFFIHPINQFLEEKDKNIRICISCTKQNLTQLGNTFFLTGKTIKATCLGKIIRWDEQTKTLEVNPIAIF
ncbi:MAG: hypothetical protein V4620_02165 [Bacteroidota bacterium]